MQRGGGNFNSSFLQGYFLNLTVKKMKIGPLLPKFTGYSEMSVLVRWRAAGEQSYRSYLSDSASKRSLQLSSSLK